MVIEGYKDLTPFRFWCQKVLPTVYDDSLSYYELLCKVVNQLNETGDDVTVLHDFVDNYFTNLDVQEEINTKLDAMAKSGKLNELFNGVVITSVEGWLNNHVTPTTPIVDASLTIEGAAADAKRTGELIYRTDRVASRSDLVPDAMAKFTPDYNTMTSITEMPPYTWMQGTGAQIEALIPGRPDPEAAEPDEDPFPWRDDLIAYPYQLFISNNKDRNSINYTWEISTLYGNVLYRGYSTANRSTWVWAKGLTRIGSDATLTIKGAAADAKAAGEMITQLSQEVDAAFLKTPYFKGNLGNKDINEIKENAIYMLNLGAHTYTHLPEDASGVMYLVSMTSNAKDTGWQILYGSTGRIYTRRYAGNQWDTWYSIDDRIERKFEWAIKGSNVNITAANKAQYFTDFNNAPLNSVYRINRGAQLDNSPYGKGMSTAAGVYDGTYRDIAGYPDGTLLTFGANNIYMAQIFVSGTISGTSSGNVPPNDSILFFRTYYSSAGWGEWHMVSNRLSTTSSNIAIRKKFIAPYLDGNGQPTATDTGVPNPQYISNDPLFFNNFNDAPNNSVYQIDLDCDETVMANNPKPRKSSVLTTTGFAYASAHGKVQTCVGVESGSTFCFVRYGYIQSSSPYVYIWTPWKELADASALETRIAALEARIAALEE